ncbi:MAG: TlpA family protein disulfide reductase, partial [Planctomycetes bacterium]|nr:TlpA family protein disulfide reductase [Planctomycetota bacterium]
MAALARALSLAIILAAVQGCRSLGVRPAEGDFLLDFPVQTLEGQRTSLFEATRGKVAVIKFGASWCPPCTKQVAHMNQLAAAYPKEAVAVVDVNLRETPEAARAYARKSGMGYTMLLDPDGAGAALYNIAGIPVTIIAGQDRKIL